MKTEHLCRTPQQLGAILQGVRKERGLSQAELARKVGIRQATISAIEADPSSTSVDYLFRVLSGLGLELVLRPKGSAAPSRKPDW